MKIALGSDHAGFEYKKAIGAFLVAAGHQIHDFGTYSTEPVDYPDFIRPAAQAVAVANTSGASFLAVRETERPWWPIGYAASAVRCAGTWKRPGLADSTITRT